MNQNKQKKFLSKAKEQQSDVYRREIKVDNLLIDLFFSEDDKPYEKTRDVKFEESKRIDEIKYIINKMIPEIEKQIIYLLFFVRKNQETVGELLKISQEMVCYYKKRALERIKMHYFFRSIDIQDMEMFLDGIVTKKQKIAMVEYFKEHDLRKISKIIAKLEGKNKKIHYEAIGSRIKLGMKKLNALIENESIEIKIREKAKLYYKIFYYLKKHNSLHHTQSKKMISREIKAK